MDLIVIDAQPSSAPKTDPKVAGPVLKAVFDLVLHLRPGISPWTFDTYHGFLLLDYLPNPDLRFSFGFTAQPEVTPLRYYELDYRFHRLAKVRAGRILIPFDDMDPHNFYGGWANVSKLMQPNATSVFLPDLWTDLGVGFRIRILEQNKMSVDGDIYLVNGFQEGGIDPLGTLGPRYPNFRFTPAPDNNTDKAIGARLSAKFEPALSVGASVYSGRYTKEADESKRILMLGTDAQLGFKGGVGIKAGYIKMKVDLLAPSTDFDRDGLYAEVFKRFGERWKLIVRGGVSQNDSRIEAVTDQFLLGAEIIYNLHVVQLALQNYNDLHKVPGKVNYNFTAIRMMANF